MEDSEYTAIRERVAKARKEAEAINKLSGRSSELDACMEMSHALLSLVKANLETQNENSWENASLAEEFLKYATPLAGYEHLLNELYYPVARMAECINEHPRLQVRLLKLELDVLHYIEAVQHHELSITEDVWDKMNRLNKNIKLADKGLLDEIETDGMLKTDPVEWTARWEEVIDEADKKVYEQLGDIPRGMGFCHAFWSARTSVLAEYFGFEWRSPARMNPGVIFD